MKSIPYPLLYSSCVSDADGCQDKDTKCPPEGKCVDLIGGHYCVFANGSRCETASGMPRQIGHLATK